MGLGATPVPSGDSPSVGLQRGLQADRQIPDYCGMRGARALFAEALSHDFVLPPSLIYCSRSPTSARV